LFANNYRLICFFFSQHFFSSFRIKKYLDGNWEEARNILTVVDKCVGRRLAKLCLGPDLMKPEDVNEGVSGDGPSRTILAFMARQGYIPPADWDSSQGRALASK
jgi:hypothetical protein